MGLFSVTVQYTNKPMVPSMRILIVDDELSNRRTLEVLLREGHTVRSASNGIEALQCLDAPSDVDHRFDECR